MAKKFVQNCKVLPARVLFGPEFRGAKHGASLQLQVTLLFSARKKHQRAEKKKRYNKNRKEKNLSNALENALNLGSTEDTVEEDPVVDYIPPPNSIALPFIPKPKKFELSFVKPAQTKELLVVGGKA